LPRHLPSPSFANPDTPAGNQPAASRWLARRRPRRWAIPVAALLVALGAPLVTALPGSAATNPTPAQVSGRLAALRLQEEQVTERYDEAAVALASSERQLRGLSLRITHLSGAVRAARARLGLIAAAAYEAGGLSAELSLLGSNGPQEMVDRAADLQTVSSIQAAAAQRLTDAMRQLLWARHRVAADVRAEHELSGSLAADRNQVLGTIGAEQALLARLTAPPPAAVVTTVTAPPVSGAAGIAVRFAYAQLGKPYQWGASGPGSYDCSGLTMRAWGAAGVSLPHSAASQQSMTAAVPSGDLAPGDLIFFGSPAYHVGIYIGSGEMIDAPYTGTDVRIDPISGYSGAGRP
jgi:cell wall-associated NlpC family hydrolase